MDVDGVDLEGASVVKTLQAIQPRTTLNPEHTRGAYIITHTILRVPDYNYSIMGPKTLYSYL